MFVCLLSFLETCPKYLESCVQSAPAVKLSIYTFDWINHYLLDNSIGFGSIYPLYSANRWINLFPLDNSIGFGFAHPIDSVFPLDSPPSNLQKTRARFLVKFSTVKVKLRLFIPCFIQTFSL